MQNHYVQQNQPPGVPPLELTGERTLPGRSGGELLVPAPPRRLRVDRRARGGASRGRPRVRRGLRVGGARRAPRPRLSGSTPTPRRTSTLAFATCGRASLRARAGRGHERPARRDRLPADDRARRRPRGACASGSPPRRPSPYISTPNRLTLAPPGAERSGNPWHVREYTAEEYRELLEPRFATVEILGLHHARKLRLHELAIRAGWDRVHPALRHHEAVLRPLRPRDLGLRLPLRTDGGRQPRPRARLRGRLPCLSATARTAGDLAIVLHSHMPYVEGFGTYPFGEEWLLDAVARSYLPVLDVAERVTLTVTPVLADQLEAAGRRRARSRGSCASSGLAPREADAADVARRASPGVPRRGGRATEAAVAADREPGGDLLAAFARPAARGAHRADDVSRDARRAAAAGDGRGQAPSGRARDALAPAPLRQAGGILAAGVRVRAGARGASWPPRGSSSSASIRARTRRGSRRSRPAATAAGPVAATIDWEAVELALVARRLPVAIPTHADFHRKSLRGCRPWAIGGGAYDPDAASARAREQASEFLDAVASRLDAFAAERGERGPPDVRDRHRAARALVVGGARAWLAEVIRLAPSRRREDAHPARGASRSASPRSARFGRRAGARARTFAPGTRRPVADLAWAARRLELRTVGALAADGLPAAGPRAGRARAARAPGERLGVPRRPPAGRRLPVPASNGPRPRACSTP